MENSSGSAIHVVGRTPGPLGKAPMVAEANGTQLHLRETGSHHEAVYLSLIIELAKLRRKGVATVHVTSTSDHLVNQMNGTWQVGPELETVHAIARSIVALFDEVTFQKAA